MDLEIIGDLLVGLGQELLELGGPVASVRQILETVDCDIPVAAAIDRVDQCVAFFGVCEPCPERCAVAATPPSPSARPALPHDP
ncbi:hypothetical protein OG389_20585 [Streptomyces sp. NBC_00435]